MDSQTSAADSQSLQIVEDDVDPNQIDSKMGSDSVFETSDKTVNIWNTQIYCITISNF